MPESSSDRIFVAKRRRDQPSGVSSRFGTFRFRESRWLDGPFATSLGTEHVQVSPVQSYLRLLAAAPMPFACDNQLHAVRSIAQTVDS